MTDHDVRELPEGQDIVARFTRAYLLTQLRTGHNWLSDPWIPRQRPLRV